MPLDPGVGDSEALPFRVALGGATGLRTDHHQVAALFGRETQAGVQQGALRFERRGPPGADDPPLHRANAACQVEGRRRQEQAAATEKIDKQDLQPGDLVFFNTLRRTFSHVGIYIGDNKFIHSPKPGAQVRVEDMGVPYWSRRFDGARRVLVAQTPPPAQ